MKNILKKVFLQFWLIRMLLLAQKTTSVILVLCVAASYFAMQIVLSPSAAMTLEISSSPMTDSYSLDFSDSGITKQSLLLLNDLFSDRIAILECYPSSGFYCTVYEDRPSLLGVKNFGHNSWYVQAEGRYFSETEVASGANVTIISRYNYEWNDFDIEAHSIDVDGIDYKIIGLGEFTTAAHFFIGKQEVYSKLSHEQEIKDLLNAAYSNHQKHSQIDELQDTYKRISQAILIPYTTYEKNNIAPTVVCIMFPSLTGKEKLDMQQALCALFPEAVITAPPDAAQLMATSAREETVISLVLSCCCLLFLYALFVFWIDRNQKAIKSCRVVGASGVTMRTTICSSWLLILFIGYLIALLLGGLCVGLFDLVKISMQLQVEYHTVWSSYDFGRPSHFRLG